MLEPAIFPPGDYEAVRSHPIFDAASGGNYHISRGTDGDPIQVEPAPNGEPALACRFRALTDPCGYEPTVGLWPYTGIAAPRITARFEVSYDPGFVIDFGCQGPGEHKLLLFEGTDPAAESGLTRWDLMVRQDSVRFNPGTTKGPLVLDVDPLELRNGEPHLFEFDLAPGSHAVVRYDGRVVGDRAHLRELDVDETPIPLPGATLGPVVKAGANMNHRPTRSQAWYLHLLEVQAP